MNIEYDKSNMILAKDLKVGDVFKTAYNVVGMICEDEHDEKIAVDLETGRILEYSKELLVLKLDATLWIKKE